MEIALTILDRRTLPIHDKSYYKHLADWRMERKGIRITMPDGQFFTAVTIPGHTADVDDRIKIHVEVKEELVKLLETGIKPHNLDVIPVEEAAAHL